MAAAMMGATAIAGGGLAAAGSAMSASQKFQNDWTNAQQSDIAAQQDDLNAKVSQEQGDIAVRQARLSGAQFMGSIRAAYGASGVTQEGTAHDYQTTASAQVADQLLNLKYDSMLKSSAYKAEAARYRLQSKAYKAGAGSDLMIGQLGSYGAILGAAGAAGAGAGSLRRVS